MLVDSAVSTSLRARTQRFSSFPMTPSFRPRLKGKTNPQDRQTGPLIVCCKWLMFCHCSWYCTDQIFLKNFTKCSIVIDFVSVTNFKIGRYIAPKNISCLPENSLKIIRIQIRSLANPLVQLFESRDADLICLSRNCDFLVATDSLFFSSKAVKVLLKL